MDKPSPSPWRYDRTLCNVYDSAGNVVASDVGAVDGRLIVASHALLDLAEQALGQLSTCADTGLAVPGDLREDFRKVIEAATGRPAPGW